MNKMHFDINGNSPGMLWLQLKDQLKQHIESNNMPFGTRLPNVKELAERAGVSVKTSERALLELVDEGICFRRPKKGTFVGRAHESDISGNNRKVLGIHYGGRASSMENDLIQGAIYRGLTRKAANSEVDIFFVPGDPEKCIKQYGESKEFIFSGLVMLHHEDIAAGIELALKYPDTRFIYLNYYIKEFEYTPENIYGIFNDDFAGAYQMAEFMIKKGHCKINILSIHLANDNYRMRIEGFKAAFMDRHIPFNNDTVQLVAREKNQSLQDVGRKLISDLLKTGTRPDSVICVNDLIAEGVFLYFKEVGINDIEVSGYDNIVPHVTRDKNIPTVAIDFEGMGEKAVELITNIRRQYGKIIRITPQLIARG